MKKQLLLLSMVSVMALVGCDVTQLSNNNNEQIIVKFEEKEAMLKIFLDILNDKVKKSNKKEVWSLIGSSLMVVLMLSFIFFALFT